jgi:hypothetical protein
MLYLLYNSNPDAMDVEVDELQATDPDQKDVDQFWKALRTLHW